jgi:endo-1,4-beta-xylanase
MVSSKISAHADRNITRLHEPYPADPAPAALLASAAIAAPDSRIDNRQAMPEMLLRRAFLTALAGLPVAVAKVARANSLRDLARAKNITFGSEVTCADIADQNYANLVARECAIITPGIEAKWGSTEPAEGRFRFGPMDDLAQFAADAGLCLHMHNLIWAVGLPNWTLAALQAGRGRAVMQNHIAAVAGRYRGRVRSWDVVNEPIDPRWPADRNGLCTTPWRLGVGADFIMDALADTALADPTARLMINDDDLEYDMPDRDKKRTGYLRLIEDLLRRGAPLHGFGLEAHVKPWLPIAEKPYRRFLHELAGFGLKLHVTEFDVNDRLMPGNADARDALVAAVARHYLDLVLDEPAVVTLITWGLSDRSTWMLRDPTGHRADGLAPRPLPYDLDLQPKKMRAAIADALYFARERPA